MNSKDILSSNRFPETFTWGAAAAAYQIEGAADEDGRAPSIWDMMCRQTGRVRGDASGAVACDHYHRYREDVALMKELGIKAYRLSVAWPRVIPDGDGAVNEKGLAFYDRLVDELLAAGIQPWVTLYHWDLPYALHCKGGWLNAQIPEWFARYTQVIVDKLSDRVRHWITINEPQCFVGHGYQTGIHAPGDKLGLCEVLRAGHHVLLAHGRSVQVIRERARTAPIVGWAPVGNINYPATDNPADIEAARAKMMAVETKNTWSNTWWNDPVFFGHYPEDGLRLFGEDAPQVAPGDMETIQQPVDFFGCNIYGGGAIRAGENGPESVPAWQGFPTNAFQWTITPRSLYWGPRFFYERYKKPVCITENGMSNCDWVSADGGVHDPQRIDYLHRYLSAMKQAIADGVDVSAYFVWSVLDNFEWAEGYAQRFGIVYVDYRTGQRIPKDSALWYRKVIESNGASLCVPYEKVEEF